MKTPQVPAMQGMTPLGVASKPNEGEFFAALQKCKEEIGQFANGDDTPQAKAAYRLYGELDEEQLATNKRITAAKRSRARAGKGWKRDE